MRLDEQIPGSRSTVYVHVGALWGIIIVCNLETSGSARITKSFHAKEVWNPLNELHFALSSAHVIKHKYTIEC